MATTAPDNQTLSRWINKALIKATYQLLGVSNFDPSSQAFLQAASSSSPVNPVQTLEDYGNDTTKYGAALLALNESIYRINDVMPAPTDIMFGTGSKSRYTEYGAYLGYIDAGADPNPQSENQYDIAKGNYDTAETAYMTALTPAWTAWQALNPQPSGGFEAWARSPAYFNHQAVQDAYNTRNQKFSLYFTAAQLYLGPQAGTLDTWVSDYGFGGLQTSTPGYTMMLPDTSFRPNYSVTNLTEFETWWSGALQMTNTKTPAFQASASLDLTMQDNWDSTSYGLVESEEAEAGFLDVPWLCYGEGLSESSSKTELWSAATGNNVTTAGVTIRVWSPPFMVETQTGLWSHGDPRSTFPNLVSGAPSDPTSMLFPFVSQIGLTYGVGFEIQLDNSTYTTLKTMVQSNSQTSSMVLFGNWFIGGVAESSSSSQYQNNFNNVSFDDQSNTMIINPVPSMLPTCLGVVVTKAAPTAATAATAMVLRSPPTTTLAAVPSFKTPNAVRDFVQKFSKYVFSQDSATRYRIFGTIIDLLRQSISIDELVEALQSSMQGKGHDDAEGTEITLEEKIGSTLLSLTIRSWSPNGKLRNGKIARSGLSTSHRELTQAATKLAHIITSHAKTTRATNGPVKPEHMLVMGLANTAGQVLREHLSNASNLATSLVKGLTATSAATSALVRSSQSPVSLPPPPAFEFACVPRPAVSNHVTWFLASTDYCQPPFQGEFQVGRQYEVTIAPAGDIGISRAYYYWTIGGGTIEVNPNSFYYDQNGTHFIINGPNDYDRDDFTLNFIMTMPGAIPSNMLVTIVPH